jgi:hypothetical protein
MYRHLSHCRSGKTWPISISAVLSVNCISPVEILEPKSSFENPFWIFNVVLLVQEKIGASTSGLIFLWPSKMH